MNKKVSVILLEDIKSLGRAGDITTVTEGYARNFLFPQGKAALVSEATQTKVAEQRAASQQQEQQQLDRLRNQAEALEGTELTLKARLKEDAGEEIFGSVTARHIAQQLNQQANLKLKAKDINLKKPLTLLGSHDVIITLAADVEATIRVSIVPDTADEK